MASIHPRKNKHGEIISWQVKWRDGDGQPSETFYDKPSAAVFKEAVDAAGQHWPPGWVRGEGYVDKSGADDERFRFRAYATRMIENRTGIEEHYRKACLRDFETYIFPTFGECDVRSPEHFSSDTIRPWVRRLEITMIHRGQKPKKGTGKLKPMSPKTIRNLHGLLSGILAEAVRAEPPLRDRNPCALTRLPRVDDDGADDDDVDVEFLEPHEVEALISHMTSRADQLLAIIAYGTGMRWGEVTALAPMCVIDSSGHRKIRVRRAWKKDGDGGYYIGKPKTPRSRRTLRISTSVDQALAELGQRLAHDALLFTGSHGQRLHYSTFHDHWKRAVRDAKRAGLIPPQKHPTPHALRHSHAAALISAGHSLTYVQRRLGHESIKTTSDTYGHLLPEADDEAMATIEATLSGSAGPRLRRVV